MEKTDLIDESATSLASVEEATKDSVIPSSQNDASTNFMFDNMQAIDAANGIDKPSNDDDLSFGSSGQASSVTATSVRIEVDPQEGTQVVICCAEEGDVGAQASGNPAPSFGDSELDDCGSTSKIEELSSQEQILSEAAPDSLLEELPAVANTKDQDESLPIHSEDREDEGFIDLGPFEQAPVGNLNTAGDSIDTESDSMQKIVVTVDPPQDSEVSSEEMPPPQTNIETAMNITSAYSSESSINGADLVQPFSSTADDAKVANEDTCNGFDSYPENPAKEEKSDVIFVEVEEKSKEPDAIAVENSDNSTSKDGDSVDEPDSLSKVPSVDEEPIAMIIESDQVDKSDNFLVRDDFDDSEEAPAGEEVEVVEIEEDQEASYNEESAADIASADDDYDVFEEAPVAEEADVKIIDEGEEHNAESEAIVLSVTDAANITNEDSPAAFEEAPAVEEEAGTKIINEAQVDGAEAINASAGEEVDANEDSFDDFDAFEESPAAEEDVDVKVVEEDQIDVAEAGTANEDEFDTFEEAPVSVEEANAMILEEERLDAAEAVSVSADDEDGGHEDAIDEFDTFEGAPAAESETDANIMDEKNNEESEAIVLSVTDAFDETPAAEEEANVRIIDEAASVGEEDDVNEDSFEDFDAFKEAPTVEEEANDMVIEEDRVDVAEAIIASAGDEDEVDANDDSFGDFDACEEAPASEDDSDVKVFEEDQVDNTEAIIASEGDEDDANEGSFDDFDDF